MNNLRKGHRQDNIESRGKNKNGKHFRTKYFPFSQPGSRRPPAAPSYSYYGFRLAIPPFVGTTQLRGVGLSALFKPYILCRGSLKGSVTPDPKVRHQGVKPPEKRLPIVQVASPFETHFSKNLTLPPIFLPPVLHPFPFSGFRPDFLALTGWLPVYRLPVSGLFEWDLFRSVSCETFLSASTASRTSLLSLTWYLKYNRW